jgi:hypothetical protein
MSPLWSDMALARAALAKVEEHDLLTHLGRQGTSKPRAVNSDASARRIPYPRFASIAL